MVVYYKHAPHTQRQILINIKTK